MQILFSTVLIAITLYAQGEWETLAPGLEHRVFSVTIPDSNSPIQINAVRIDPNTWEMVYRGTSQEDDGQPKTPRGWCEEYSLTAAINAGMYNEDYITHTGYLTDGEHVNSSFKNNYRSLLAFNPKPGKYVPAVKIFDLDQPGVTIDNVLEDYSTVIQNLRLIKRPGINVWSPRQEYWSEAAIAEDKQGRILFLFCETPVSMYDFNQILLSSDLEIVAAQHLDGNGPAQLYLNAGSTMIELSGNGDEALEIPNVIGIRKRTAK